MSPPILSLWRSLPAPLRRQAHLSAQALELWATPPRVALRWRRGRPARGRIFVAGLFSSASGVGQSARLFAQALEDAGVSVERIDVGPALKRSGALPSPPGSWGGDGVMVTHLNPPELERWLGGDGARALRGKRHIGYWVWELEQPPEAWRRAVRYVDEIWTPSAFAAKALRPIAPDVAVRTVPHPIFVLPRPPSDRARFGLPDAACVVLASFDLRSTAARKNPTGALSAFLRACPRPRPEQAMLLCKVRDSGIDPALMQPLTAAAAGRPDIRLLHDELDEAGMLQLIASVDVVLSLHRSEGFGLTPAEALWLGVPVIATAYSGVMDFLDRDSAALVDWRPEPVQDVQGMYAGGVWAEPDREAAATRLRELIDDPARRAALGARGRMRAERVFDQAAWLAHVRPGLGLWAT